MCDLNIVCTNISTYLVVKVKFISFVVLECSKISLRGVRPKVASGQKYSSGFDVTDLMRPQ